MTHPTHASATAMPSHPSSAHPLARWLTVTAAIGLIGVSIDLFKGPPAQALPAPAAQGIAAGDMPLDHAVVAKLVDADPLAAGASVAVYELPAQDAAAASVAATAKPALADDTLHAGASVAAYGD